MNIGAVTIMIIVMVVVTLLFAWGLQRTYMDKLENSKLTSIVAVGALSVTLLCVLLIRTWNAGRNSGSEPAGITGSASTRSPEFVLSSVVISLTFAVVFCGAAALCSAVLLRM
jgi:hypothetical protein